MRGDSSGDDGGGNHSGENCQETKNEKQKTKNEKGKETSELPPFHWTAKSLDFCTNGAIRQMELSPHPVRVGRS